MIKPENAANYLITLYMRTKFQCEKRKLQKVIIYADLIFYAFTKERLLIPDVITATPKGLSIDRISHKIYDLFFNFLNDNREIDLEKEIDWQKNISLSSVYDVKELSDDDKEILQYTFIKLGAYSGANLTIMSRKTSLWQNARSKAEGSESPIITLAMYDDFLENMNIDYCLSEDGIRNQIVDYLTSLLN